VFLLNSCLGRFSAATLLWLPFSLTYGVNLPSSLTTLIPLVLGFSPHPPVSVCGTGAFSLNSGFSCQRGIGCFATNFAPHQAFETPGVLHTRAIHLPWTGSSSRRLILSPCVPASLKQLTAVHEFQHVVHRLRFSASA
jgi:hypothetical protein